MMGLAFADACKMVSQADLNGSGTAVLPGAAVLPTDGGDAAVGRDVGAGICKRHAGTLPRLPEVGLVQGQPCVHNRQCENGTYCEDETFVCTPGAPGAGRNGVAPCTKGNMCTSGLCVQDASKSYTCSDACECDQDCGGKLPKCVLEPTLGIGVCTRS